MSMQFGSSDDLEAALHCLFEMENEITYIIESLAQDYTGEAKGSLSELEARIPGWSSLAPAQSRSLQREVAEVRQCLIGNSSNPEARRRMVDLRRRVHNTARALRTLGQMYPYSAPLDLSLRPATSNVLVPIDLSERYPKLRAEFEYESRIVLLSGAAARLAAQVVPLAVELTELKYIDPVDGLLEQDGPVMRVLAISQALMQEPSCKATSLAFSLPDPHYLSDTRWEWCYDFLMGRLRFGSRGEHGGVSFGCLDASGLQQFARLARSQLAWFERDPDLAAWAPALIDLAEAIETRACALEQLPPGGALAWVTVTWPDSWGGHLNRVVK